MPRSAEWMSSGTRLVTRILIRRRVKCQREGKHENNWESRFPVRCRACGVDS